ncbi:hypothetical protein N7E02_23660 [Aliirhizobium terrae]|uniref:hypothetical protein n=1 Tax=Terrirhizobium terrae TaxID=2926709 RepID=UPI0025755BED|nr:hypothetical protein [Rhizobium sp. CC-CFT758]WJH39717.1 hypothetical protein N7E02_23660 [Rhizobium sp. CC-CFT758]
MDERQKHSRHSTLRENIVEHLFAGELLRRLWQKGVVDAELLKSEFDAGGYDLVLSRGRITRHIQLKVSRKGGARASVGVNLRLAEKPSGCIVWIVVDDDLNLLTYRWFGGLPGEPLPDVTEMKQLRHTKANALGMKAVRDGHRSIGEKTFEPIDGIDVLLGRLLGELL